MKSWCDLSWTEKQKIEEGEAEEYKYSTGYTFQVKTKVKEGKKAKQERSKDVY